MLNCLHVGRNYGTEEHNSTEGKDVNFSREFVHTQKNTHMVALQSRLLIDGLREQQMRHQT